MIPFVKAHACGNDFLIIEEQFAADRHSGIAERLCARHTGVGADGIEFLHRGSDGSMRLRLFNADGSEAELSGNGTRCVAAWLAISEQMHETTFDTLGGARRCRVITSSGSHVQIESQMGVPGISPKTIDVRGIGPVHGAVVNVGNPHFTIFVETPDFSVAGHSWQEIGFRISSAPIFPQGTNVEFIRVISPAEIEFRIFERGCGPTASSGTGTCASAAASIALHGADRSLTAVAEGGPQSVAWPSDGEEMRLTGPAEILCQGQAFC